MKGYRVFIGCIPGDSSEAELASLLGEYARVSAVSLARDINRHQQQYCLGYGFAVCPSREDKRALISHANDVCYRGRFITLREYKSGRRLKEDKQDFNLRRVFVGNIPARTSNTSLEKLFSRFGEVETVYSVDQSAKKLFKFGYVVFCDKHAAALTVQNKHEFVVDGHALRLEYFNGKRSLEAEHLAAPLRPALASPFLNRNHSQAQATHTIEEDRGSLTVPNLQAALSVSSAEARPGDSSSHLEASVYATARPHRGAASRPKAVGSSVFSKHQSPQSHAGDTRLSAREPDPHSRNRKPLLAPLAPQQLREAGAPVSTRSSRDAVDLRRVRPATPLADPRTGPRQAGGPSSRSPTAAFETGLLAQVGTNHVGKNIRLNIAHRKQPGLAPSRSGLPPAAASRLPLSCTLQA